jgi:putative transcriptional regulator
MPNATWLTDHFLIAMPAMQDPHFSRTVTYICQHDADGAMGIVVNRTASLTLGEVLRQMSLDSDDRAVTGAPVFLGGPVQPERGFVLHDPGGAWDSTLNVTPKLAITTSRDVLAAIAGGSGPKRAMLALGCAGWSAGQLESELRDNAWLAAPADEALIFEVPPEKRWEAATRLVGVDPSRLSDYGGHA